MLACLAGWELKMERAMAPGLFRCQHIAVTNELASEGFGERVLNWLLLFFYIQGWHYDFCF